MMQAERRDRLLPPRNDNHRPSIHSKTAALLREQHAGGSQTARPIAVDERSSADPARSRRTTAISREPAARCGGTHGRRHAPAMGEGQGPTPWLFSSTKRPIHEKKGGEATTTLFFSCWVGFLMTTHVVPPGAGAAGAYGPGNHCSVLEACMCTRGYSCIASDDYRMNCDYAAPACAPLLDLAQIVIVLIVRGVFFGV